MKIAVYTIALNEAKFAESFMASCIDADAVIVADTGSTDGTPELLRTRGALVHDIVVTPWRFDVARNASLALVPRDFDVCICLDLDEELQPGWRKNLEYAWKDETTRLRYKFDWGSGIVFHGEKIHQRHGYLWKHPCHERLVADGRIAERLTWTDDLLVVHNADPEKSRGQYLDLLKLAVDEDPHCVRSALYYGRELIFANRYDEAAARLEAYLRMPGATWVEERAYALRLLSQCAEYQGRFSDAVRWARLNVTEQPATRESWWALAWACYRDGRWAECYGAARTALEITTPSLIYTADPSCWGSKLHDLAAISAWRLGLPAEQHALDALRFDPHDSRLVANLKLIRGEQAA